MLQFIKHNHRHHHRVLGFFVVIAMLYTSIGIGINNNNKFVERHSALASEALAVHWYIGIARDQYYWVLDIGCLSWYRSNPNDN